MVIYQIYPRSFNDSNGDGIGDLEGVIKKLDYLQDLGVNAIWLCPCYKSPNRDNGYDVADYRDIMDEFGTMDSALKLISEMKKRGMTLIMDLVPNHTSDQHKWFVESRKSKDNPYSDYYYWFDEPINDWLASFGGSVWQYDETRGQYYMHSYTAGQPDLNWTNPRVIKEMQDVVDFWVNLGVGGFRIDVIDQISKDFDGVGYPGGRNCFGPELHNYINQLFGRKETEHIFTVGECWAGTIDEIKRHIGADRGELSTLFQFDHLDCGRDDKFTKKPDSLKSLRNILVKWQNLMQENDLLHSLFTDNHDNSPFISRMGDTEAKRYETATCIAAMVYLLKGVPFVYQGQEFGTVAPEYKSIDSFDDVESFNAYNEYIKSGLTPEQAVEKINFGSRDNSRRPIAWNSSEGRGFSSAKPWIEHNSHSSEINLENDQSSDKSVFSFYKSLLGLRNKYSALRQGSFKCISDEEDSFFMFERALDGDVFTVICNFESESEIPLTEACKTLLLSNLGRDGSDVFKPYEIAVYKN